MSFSAALRIKAQVTLKAFLPEGVKVMGNVTPVTGRVNNPVGGRPTPLWLSVVLRLDTLKTRV